MIPLWKSSIKLPVELPVAPALALARRCAVPNTVSLWINFAHTQKECFFVNSFCTYAKRGKAENAPAHESQIEVESIMPKFRVVDVE